ncbi:MAG: DNA-deoxyinosine glycosylase [Spirochaetaceae bacterium]|nr:DNA-deoxyinosine glycosylase [Spirochaetaceae bacterium]
MSDAPFQSPLLRGLPPILPGGPIRALVLGSFPSVASLASMQYYGNPHNWFWRVLAACGVVADAAAPYGERTAAVRERGVAVWDLYGAVRRPGSGDDAIRDAQPNPIGTLFERRGPFPILLNGRRGREWRRHFAALGVEPVALPSTSPRPLHWNTPAARAAAAAEWCAALRAAGVATPPDPVPCNSP